MDELPGRFWHALDDGRLQCNLCPRYCKLKDGQRAFCFVRERQGDRIVLATYGRSTGFCVDPIEKKPLNHFLVGTPILSFGTAGCNLGCRFCQNWDISKSREVDRLASEAMPDDIARAAADHGCASVAYTYNESSSRNAAASSIPQSRIVSLKCVAMATLSRSSDTAGKGIRSANARSVARSSTSNPIIGPAKR